MPGIITITGTSGSVKTYRAVFTSTSTSLAINFVTGTTSGVGTVNDPNDKGVSVIFQNQSSAANVTIGGAGVTVNALGIVIQALSSLTPGTYQIPPRGGPSAMQMGEWYVTSTSSLAAVVAQLVKYV